MPRQADIVEMNNYNYECSLGIEFKLIAQRVHSGGKPNKCDQCNFSTSQTANLKNHMKIPSGDNPTSVTDAIFQHLKQKILKII